MNKFLDIDIASIKSSEMEDPKFMVMLMEAGETQITNEKHYHKHCKVMKNVIRQWCVEILSHCETTTPLTILNRLIQTIGMEFEENEIIVMLESCGSKNVKLPLPFILDIAKHTKNYHITKKCCEYDVRVLDFFNANPIPIEVSNGGLVLTTYLDSVLEDGCIPICIIISKNLKVDDYAASYLETAGIKLGSIFCSTVENNYKDLHNTLIIPKIGIKSK